MPASTGVNEALLWLSLLGVTAADEFVNAGCEAEQLRFATVPSKYSIPVNCVRSGLMGARTATSVSETSSWSV